MHINKEKIINKYYKFIDFIPLWLPAYIGNNFFYIIKSTTTTTSTNIIQYVVLDYGKGEATKKKFAFYLFMWNYYYDYFLVLKK